MTSLIKAILLENRLPWKYANKIDPIRFKYFYKKLRDKKNIFYVILVPNTLHAFNKFKKLIPEDLNIIIIDNGLKKYEKKQLHTKFPIFKFSSGQMIPHGTILDIFFDNSKKNFGIIDFDCFIFDTQYYSQIIHIENNALVNSFFSDNQLKFKTPRTHFMFFNTKNFNKIRNKHNLSCCKDYPNNFDTMQKIFKKNHETYKHKINFLPYKKQDLIHIGGLASNINNPKGNYHLQGTYLWVKLLEMEQNPILKRKYSRIINLEIFKTKFPKFMKSKYKRNVDKLVKRL